MNAYGIPAEDEMDKYAALQMPNPLMFKTMQLALVNIYGHFKIGKMQEWKETVSLVTFFQTMHCAHSQRPHATSKTTENRQYSANFSCTATV